MSAEKRGRIFCIMAGVCFVICGMVELGIQRERGWWTGSLLMSLLHNSNLPMACGYVGCAVLLFWGRKKKSFLIFPGLMIMSLLCNEIELKIFGYPIFENWFQIIQILTYMAFMMILLVNICPLFHKKERNLRILDFLPCILALPLNIGAISDMVEYGEYDYKFYGLYCARYVFLFAALLFAALGLRNGLTKEKQVSQLRGLQEKDTPRMQDVFGGSEALKTCKELLDMGIITQEEFDEKKRQILGL